MLVRREQLKTPIVELGNYGLSSKFIAVLEGMLDGDERIVLVEHVSTLTEGQLLAAPDFGTAGLDEWRSALRAFLRDRKVSKEREEKQRKGKL